IAGAAQVGQTLTVDASSWELTAGGTHPLALSYQWYRSGKAISSAKSASYTLAVADLSKTMTVKVTGKSIGYTTVSKTSPKTAKVVRGTIAGAAGADVTLDPTKMRLTVAPTGVTEQGVKYTYRWLRNGKS